MLNWINRWKFKRRAVALGEMFDSQTYEMINTTSIQRWIDDVVKCNQQKFLYSHLRTQANYIFQRSEWLLVFQQALKPNEMAALARDCWHHAMHQYPLPRRDVRLDIFLNTVDTLIQHDSTVELHLRKAMLSYVYETLKYEDYEQRRKQLLDFGRNAWIDDKLLTLKTKPIHEHEQHTALSAYH